MDVVVNVGVNAGITPEPTATRTPEATATPESTRTPTPRPTPTEAPKVRPAFSFKELKKGDVWFAKKGDIVVGDLEINDQIVYDQLENTGVMTVLEEDAKVTARENAGAVLHPNQGADINEILERKKQETLKAHPEIKEVDIQVFPGKTQGQKEELVPTATRTPTRTPTPRPTPIETPRLDLGKPINFSQGETRAVFGRTVVSGDVKVNGERKHDDLAETAAINVVIGTAIIEAPFGASGLTDFATDSGLTQAAEKIVRQKLNEGFREVTVNTIRDGRVIGSRTFTKDSQ